MDLRERLEAFWRGEKPDFIPYTAYSFFFDRLRDDPDMRRLFDHGLGLTYPISPYDETGPGVEVVHQQEKRDGQTVARTIYRCPEGEVFAERTGNWHSKYLLETADDYRVMTAIARRYEARPNYERWRAEADRVESFGVAMSRTGRTPIQRILVDYAGLENFSTHLFEMEEPVLELYDALLDQFRRQVEIVAEGPGTYVMVLENFTAETLGPQRYERFLSPVYEMHFPLLQQAGKVVGTHYDGQIGSVADLIRLAPMDVIESLTPPPEGDLTLAEARAALPDKCFWSNLNVSLYDLPDRELREIVLARVTEAAVDGQCLAFEVSEDIPALWRTKLATVLSALREAAGLPPVGR